MKNKQFHERWGDKYPIPREAIDYAYSLIDKPLKQREYLEYLTKVTEWWDDNDISYILDVIKKNCKTPADREKTEKKYQAYLSDQLLGVLPFKGARFTSKVAKITTFQALFFAGRTTGRDLSRVKDIGYFQSYMQQKYIRPKGRPYLLAWYLHHQIDYGDQLYEWTLPLTDIINRNRERIKPIYPAEYDEVASFVQQHWEELKHDFESY